MSKRFSLFKMVTLFALLAVLVGTRVGIAQPAAKVAPLDMAYQLISGNMVQWAALAFQEAAKATPDSIEAHLLGGLAWQVADKQTQALQAWGEAVDLGEEAASSFLGDILFETGDLPGAKAAYERAAEALPRAAKPHLGLALIAERENDLETAIQYLEPLTVLPTTPEEAEFFVPTTEAYYHLGRLYLANEQIEEAQETLQIGTQLNSHHPDMHLMLATAYEKNGRLTEAVHLFERALQLNPASAVAQEALKRLQ